jgi:hypothetical protein
MLAAQITLPHFSVSSAIKFPNYIGPWCAGVRPRYFARSPDANASGRRAGQRNRRRGRTSGVAARLIETSDDALLDRIAASDTIGIVNVAALAASTEAVPPVAAMTACALPLVGRGSLPPDAGKLREPTKPRAHIILCYAPILVLTPLGIFAVDSIAKPLK